MMNEILYEKFNNEIDVYKFLNRISRDKLVRVISILPLSGSEEGNFELYYKFVDENIKKISMFEKEVEEIAKDIYIHRFDDDVNYPEVLKAITVGVQKGVELGYNKVNEWHNLNENSNDLPNEGEWVEGLYI